MPAVDYYANSPLSPRKTRVSAKSGSSRVCAKARTTLPITLTLLSAALVRILLRTLRQSIALLRRGLYLLIEIRRDSFDRVVDGHFTGNGLA